MKVRFNDALLAALDAARVRHQVPVAEICRRAWRKGRRLEAKYAETFRVVLRQFAQSATREASEPVEVLFPCEPALAEWVETRTGLELAALVAYSLHLAAQRPAPPAFTPPASELAQLTPKGR
jgi:hypothetical protein